MTSVDIGGAGLSGSRLVYGCMRIAGDGSSDAVARGSRALRAALDAGFTVFDHADIYADGRAESLFGDLLRSSPSLRDSMVLIGKCGIVVGDGVLPKHYDLTRAHILRSVEGSLDRLGTEQLDVLLLHRPDYLFDPDDVADAFERLAAAGKVAHFGVSNFSVPQLRLLGAALDRPLVAHQFELNLENPAALEDGTLDQCRELGITPQAWSPLAGTVHTGPAARLSDRQRRRLQAELAVQGEKYGTDGWLVVLAWLLHHPSGIMPVIGSTTPSRIRSAARALDIEYTRADWYALLQARNDAPVP